MYKWSRVIAIPSTHTQWREILDKTNKVFCVSVRLILQSCTVHSALKHFYYSLSWGPLFLVVSFFFSLEVKKVQH